jgi:hypothetical protein
VLSASQARQLAYSLLHASEALSEQIEMNKASDEAIKKLLE